MIFGEPRWLYFVSLDGMVITGETPKSWRAWAVTLGETGRFKAASFRRLHLEYLDVLDSNAMAVIIGEPWRLQLKKLGRSCVENRAGYNWRAWVVIIGQAKRL